MQAFLKPRWPWTLVAWITLTSGCAGQPQGSGNALSERQRDSILARSALPGAGVVGRALEASDQAASRSAAMDTLFR